MAEPATLSPGREMSERMPGAVPAATMGVGHGVALALIGALLVLLDAVTEQGARWGAWGLLALGVGIALFDLWGRRRVERA